MTTEPLATVPPFLLGPAQLGAPKVTRDDAAISSPVVVVRPTYSRRHPTEVVPAVIVSAARVWCEVESVAPNPSTGRVRTFRLRLDDQTDGTNSYYAVRWRTPAQHEYHEALRSANEFLSDQGIHLGLGSRWNDPADRIELARLVWPHRRVTA